MSTTDIVKAKGTAEIAKATWFTEKDIEVLKNTVLNTLKTQAQVILALNVAKKYDLDIFAKEFWAWVDNKSRLITIASAEGFKKIARKQTWFISIQANAVFEGEEFSLNTGTGEVNHIINLKNRGKDKSPVGAYARLKMKGKEDEVKWVDWAEYANDQVTFSSPWKKQKSAMIEKCAITVLCRQAFWLSGLYWEEETDSMRNLSKNVSNETDIENVDNTVADLEAEILNKTSKTEETIIVEAEEIVEAKVVKEENIDAVL